MLKTAFNYVSRDFNRERVAVWHVVELDDAEYEKDMITSWRLLCGDKRIKPILQYGFVTIEELAEGTGLPEDDEACGRCVRSLQARINGHGRSRRS
jgi:bacterioferritin-associated ferredoxin